MSKFSHLEIYTGQRVVYVPTSSRLQRITILSILMTHGGLVILCWEILYFSLKTPVSERSFPFLFKYSKLRFNNFHNLKELSE